MCVAQTHVWVWAGSDGSEGLLSCAGGVGAGVEVEPELPAEGLLAEPELPELELTDGLPVHGRLDWEPLLPGLLAELELPALPEPADGLAAGGLLDWAVLPPEPLPWLFISEEAAWEEGLPGLLLLVSSVSDPSFRESSWSSSAEAVISVSVFVSEPLSATLPSPTHPASRQADSHRAKSILAISFTFFFMVSFSLSYC